MEDAVELNGKRIVVVEDDFLLATDICRELRNLGATVLGPAPTPFYAMQLINRKRIDVAVLDVRLHGATVFDVADVLKLQGVPILFTTALADSDLPGRFRDTPLIEKPLDRKDLITKIKALTRPVSPKTETAQWPPRALTQGPPAQTFALALASRLGQG